MIRKGLRPGLKPVIDLPVDDDSLRRVLPFRRSWIAILVLAAMDAVFIFPAVTTFNQALTEWGRFESLFDLVAALFLSAWLLGWIIAPLLMTGVLLMMLFGREVLKAGPGNVQIFVGLPLLGLEANYDAAKIRNLRFERPLKKSGTSWRGTHLLFEYGANTVAVGSDIDASEVAALRSQIQMATGVSLRRGEALEDEMQPAWEPDENLATPLASTAITHDNVPLSLTSASSLLLIAANLIPIAGSVFWGWNLSWVMVLYWAESAVIGFFNICKIIVIGRWSALLFGPFFVGHFGAFMAVHFLFIYTIFIEQPQTGDSSYGDLSGVIDLFVDLWPALLALFISHAFSFYENFLGRQEYRGRTVNEQMSEPYSRIIFMQFVLILGGGLSLILGGPTPVVLIVIGLKIYFDLKAHLKQHQGGK